LSKADIQLILVKKAATDAKQTLGSGSIFTDSHRL